MLSAGSITQPVRPSALRAGQRWEMPVRSSTRTRRTVSSSNLVAAGLKTALTVAGQPRRREDRVPVVPLEELRLPVKRNAPGIRSIRVDTTPPGDMPATFERDEVHGHHPARRSEPDAFGRRPCASPPTRSSRPGSVPGYGPIFNAGVIQRDGVFHLFARGVRDGYRSERGAGPAVPRLHLGRARLHVPRRAHVRVPAGARRERSRTRSSTRIPECSSFGARARSGS